MPGVNVIFMGNLVYPEGLAGTKRFQHFIDGVQSGDGNSARILLLRQSHPGRNDGRLDGEHRGVLYATIGADIGGSGLFAPLWRYVVRGCRLLLRYRRSGVPNVLFLYGEPNVENVWFLIWARLLGYRVLCDIVEDCFLIPANPGWTSRLKAFSGQWATRHIAWFADGVIVISTYLKAKFETIVAGRRPVGLLPISVDIGSYPKPAAGGFHDPVRILYAGNFGDKDGVEILIAGFDLVAHRWPAAELVMTGRGSPGRMAAVRRRMADSPFADRIHYLGFLPDGEYYGVVAGCDVACVVRVKSEFAERGFPFKLGEYLASGRPVVTSRVGDVTEYLQDRVSAVLVEPGSATGIAAALEFLLGNEARALDIGRAGREIAREHFDARNVGRKLNEFIDRLVAR